MNVIVSESSGGATAIARCSAAASDSAIAIMRMPVSARFIVMKSGRADAEERFASASAHPSKSVLVRGGGEVDRVVDRSSGRGIGDNDVPRIVTRRGVGTGRRERRG